jgi:divalent metal cation (Fe/Co/Zn/Cd) transporter
VDAHMIIDDLEKRISDELNINMVIHIDPITTDKEKIARMEQLIKSAVEEVNKSCSMYNMRMTIGHSIINVIFELSIPPSLAKEADSIRKETIRKLKEKNPNLNVIIDSVTLSTQE